MQKTSTESPDLVRHALNGATMGTRWSALFFSEPDFDVAPVQEALQNCVDAVDAQMSTWNPSSDLMRLSNAPTGVSIEVPHDLAQVLALGLRIGRASGGAFDMGMGDAVSAWGFGPQAANAQAIHNALRKPRRPAHEVIELAGHTVRKHAPITLDLNGIAKGYGIDRLAETLIAFNIPSALVGIDGELRAMGLRPDGQAWTIAVEAPDPQCRAPHSIVDLHDASIATSGDYRHRIMVQGQHLSHTMDPKLGAPLRASPASVTVVAPTCAQADAWATALMVMDTEAAARFIEQQGLGALFLLRDETGKVQSKGYGQVFSAPALQGHRLSFA